MRLTRFGLNGLLFYLLMVWAFFASPYSNLVFLLLGFLTLLGGGGLAAAFLNMRGVEVRVRATGPLPSGTETRIAATVSVRGRTRFQVTAWMELEDGTRIEGRADALEGEATLELQVPALERGCYRFQRAWLESSHPLGLIAVRRAFAPPQELVVYPAPGELLVGRSAAEAMEELMGGGPAAGDLQPSSLRDHREGDGVRGVHWRASARRARLVVLEWEGGTGRGLEVLLDRRAEPEALERALSRVSALIHLARTRKESLRIHTQGSSATYGEGHRPWSEAQRLLATTAALPEDGPAPPTVSPAVLRLPRDESREALGSVR